ncbi:hypothetical protein J2T14_004543 [Paenibacillus harenae]|nr:hypothetical protein [Paenibacillus harenae]
MALPFSPCPKPSYGRNKPTAKQRGSISTKVRRHLRERSNGICERCHYALATEAAHLVRRWRIEVCTTVTDLAHLCNKCHTACDTTAEGRTWLSDFRRHLEEKANE